MEPGGFSILNFIYILVSPLCTPVRRVNVLATLVKQAWPMDRMFA
jgi:hypothetical protein